MTSSFCFTHYDRNVIFFFFFFYFCLFSIQNYRSFILSHWPTTAFIGPSYPGIAFLKCAAFIKICYCSSPTLFWPEVSYLLWDETQAAGRYANSVRRCQEGRLYGCCLSTPFLLKEIGYTNFFSHVFLKHLEQFCSSLYSISLCL